MNVFDLFATLSLDKSSYEQGLGLAESKAKGFGSTVTKALGVGVKAVAAGVAAGTTAVVAMTKQATDAYADFEQLVGGVETLFGAQGQSWDEYAKSIGLSAESSRKEVLKAHEDYQGFLTAQKTVLSNASKAFKTAGLSANEYMETATSFAAALSNSLNGNTQEAAKKADLAITDMADNANKMGTSMESIQNAYNGFSKQNYTMLDNLKLGYGGTKEEMQRLLDDASKLPKALGKKFDISNYADIVDAIHLVQDEMGITGTTSREAATTITGSSLMMKAAWQNFLTGMGDDSEMFNTATKDLVDSVITYAKNIGPRVVQILPNVVEGITELTEGLIPYVPTIIEELLPSLLNGGISLVETLIENLPVIFGALGQALKDVLNPILQEAFGFTVDDVITEFTDRLNTVTDWIDEHKTGLEVLGVVIGSIAAAIGLVSAAIGIWSAVTTVATAVAGGFSAAVAFLTSPLTLIVAAIAAVIAVGVLLYKNWDTIKEKAKELGDGIAKTFDKIRDDISKKIDDAKTAVGNAIEKIKGFFKFEWSLPPLKLPHPYISGSFSLNPPSVPSFGIDWYAKAMNDPIIMNTPTAFGINSMGQLMAGGEAGSEVVSGTDTLMSMISAAVGTQNGDIIAMLAEILAAIRSGKVIQLDTGAFVGQTVDAFDSALGRRYSQQARSV